MKTILNHFAVSLLLLIVVPGKLSSQANSEVDYDKNKYAESSERDTTIKAHKNFHATVLFDPSGFITFGPAVYIEPAIGKHLSILGGFRVSNLGLITYLYTGDLSMSYTAHLSLRVYVKPRQKTDGFFLGPLVEYGRSNKSSGYDRNVRVFGGEIGYKLLWKENLSFELADNIGLIQSRVVKNAGPTAYFPVSHPWQTDMFVFYVVSLKIGITF